jgi:hypothetical protein
MGIRPSRPRGVSFPVSSGFIGVDPAGVQAWKTRLDAKHAQVISVLNEYRALAQQNNDVAHGSHFTNINTQCEDITNKHVTDHTDLHSQYTTASNKLVQGVMDVAGA